MKLGLHSIVTSYFVNIKKNDISKSQLIVAVQILAPSITARIERQCISGTCSARDGDKKRESPSHTSAYPRP